MSEAVSVPLPRRLCSPRAKDGAVEIPRVRTGGWVPAFGSCSSFFEMRGAAPAFVICHIQASGRIAALVEFLFSFIFFTLSDEPSYDATERMI